jgi:ABC-type methionine transport system permease subunit
MNMQHMAIPVKEFFIGRCIGNEAAVQALVYSLPLFFEQLFGQTRLSPD